MEAPSTVSCYVPQHSSRKRAFPGESSSSSSSGCKEEEVVLKIPPPFSYCAAKNKPTFKQKEVIPCKIIIDIDDDDDHDDEVMLIDGDVWTSAKGKAKNENSASPIASASAEVQDANEILPEVIVFKKLDTVEDYTDHHYSYYRLAKRPQKNWVKRIQEEWKILEKDLPDKIFVRVYESRMDLLRAVIVGAEGTPYHDGLYFFDVCFPNKYPNVPPQVYYLSGGLQINPNFLGGEVCLSLLNTYEGREEEMWVPGTSTLLQVLVSIQGLILNAKPYFNVHRNNANSEYTQRCALDYNEEVFMASLRTMLYNIRRPPMHFEDFVVKHFRKHGRDILVYCKAYIDGAQVGCVAKGGVQDVDEGDKSCAEWFKYMLAGFIRDVINAFSQIGVKDCEEFLSSAQEEPGTPQFYAYYIKNFGLKIATINAYMQGKERSLPKLLP